MCPLNRGKTRVLQKELTDTVGCSDQAISDWECGRYLPSEERLYRLCRMLRLTKEDTATLTQVYLADRDKHLLQRMKLRGMVLPWERRPKTHAPLYRCVGPGSDNVQQDPLDVVNSNTWAGSYFERPFGLTRYSFAFQLTDQAMAPQYSPGDVVFCDLLLKLESRPRNPVPVVACARNKVVCRLLVRREGSIALRAGNSKTVVVPTKDVAWCYRVVLRVSYEI